MKTSPTIENITKALIAFQGEMRPVKRTKVVKSKSFEFRYAPLDEIMESATPIMQKHGLMVAQAINMDDLTTRVFHSSGEFIESQTFLNQQHANMQGFGGEITYKRRYALCALLGIVSDDDTDAPKITARGALEEMLNELPERRQIFLRNLAEIIKENFASGNEWGAYEEYITVEDQEERAGLWSLLPSNVRTALTKLRKEEDQKGKA